MLGVLPRMTVRHTSEEERGQIYVPIINWMLMLGTIYLVLEFRSSSNLAAAYGIAVTLTMVITTGSRTSWFADAGAGASGAPAGSLCCF
jgi:KUP system potassium uptake protein